MKNTPSYLLLEKPSSTFILPRRQQYRRFAINGIDYGFHLRHFAPSLLQGHVPREFYDSFDQGWSRVMIARCWNHWRCFVTSVSNILLHLNDIDIPSIQVYFETKYNSKSIGISSIETLSNAFILPQIAVYRNWTFDPFQKSFECVSNSFDS